MSPRRLPPLKPDAVIRALERAGFFVARTRGSHYLLKNADGSRRVTVPFHRKDLRAGTLHAIIRDSGLSMEQFMELL